MVFLVGFGHWLARPRRKTTTVSSPPHFVHQQTGGDLLFAQESPELKRMFSPKLRGPHRMENGKRWGYLAGWHQVSTETANALQPLLRVRHYEDEEHCYILYTITRPDMNSSSPSLDLMSVTYRRRL